MPRFRGGVHPDDQKSSTRHKPIQTLAAPAQLVFPLLMHVGPLCKPLVEVGHAVRIGQKIADSPQTGGSPPIHSSVSGMVSAIEPRPHPSGRSIPAIIIENDGKDTPDPSLAPYGSVGSLTAEQLLAITLECGLTGMGGAAFPSHAKLHSAAGKVRILVINGAESEPYITSDHRVMLESPEEVIGGVRIFMKILGIAEAVIAVESNKPDAAAALRRTLPRGGGGISVRLLATRYPQGSEKHLIYAITRRKVPPGTLPFQAGALVFNVQTAMTLHRAVTTGFPLIRRVVTVSGSAVSNPRNFMVPIGTPLSTLFEATGGFRERPEKIIAGGPMTGIAQHNLGAPVIKSTGGLLAFTARDVKPEDPGVCIRCGKCLSVCPMHLVPCLMYQAGQAESLDGCRRLGVQDCFECGCCSYICPARLHLVQSFRTVKLKLQGSGGGVHA
jgi:electron transport complex protein RnfC